MIHFLNNDNNELYCIGPWINPDIHKNTVAYYISSLLDINNILNICDSINPDLIVIGPEVILETNFVDICHSKNYHCIGPSQKLAQLETSKIFTRNLLTTINKDKYNPKYIYSSLKTIRNDMQNFIFNNNIDIVIKLDGLASGKGVFVQKDHFDTIENGILLVENSSTNNIVIEEKLIGEEFSLFTFSDGEHFFHLPPIQDYKRAFNYNKGPNTGGM